MMRNVALLLLLAGVSAEPSTSDIMRMTLKTRSVGDVSLAMEEEDHSEPAGHTTSEEMGGARVAFVGLAILSAGLAFGTYKYIMGPGAISEQQEEVIYNKAAPAALVTIAVLVFFSTVGSIMTLNKKVYSQMPKKNLPGYEGKTMAYERIDNPGERAFFASFAIIAQAIIGLLICLYLRKQQNVQMSRSMIMKMGCRGAVAGTLATLFVEFIRLPFHDYMMNEELVIGRVFVVLLWVGCVAIMEEVVKIGGVALGLKRNADDIEAVPAHPLAQFIAESPQALAICGLAVGMGFAIVENIPRMYAIALERPLAEIEYSYMGASENFVTNEDNLRAARLWTFTFWGLFNIQPWLTAIATMQLAQITGKGPIAPMDWLSVLKFVVIVHFFFDLLDRSVHPVVEFVGICAIPYAMYTFKKQWESLQGDGLLADRQ